MTAFLADGVAQAKSQGGLVACVEVCGFNEWLLALLHQVGCAQVILVQPDDRDRRKSDRRDAKRLSELLWLNQSRLAERGPLEGLRRVLIPSRARAARSCRTSK